MQIYLEDLFLNYFWQIKDVHDFVCLSFGAEPKMKQIILKEKPHRTTFAKKNHAKPISNLKVWLVHFGPDR